MALFHFTIDKGEIKDGWLRQLHRSSGGGDKFLLNPAIFGCNTVKEFEKFDFNNSLYQKGSDFESHKFKTGLMSDIMDKFFSAFIKTAESESITNKNEKLIKQVYDTLCKLYEFNS